ncbi:MAG: alpha/beta fold hydrolase [Rhizobacter sp.]|nr:alpha/beta fold hydrolase [Chlorobiales bacterium]
MKVIKIVGVVAAVWLLVFAADAAAQTSLYKVGAATVSLKDGRRNREILAELWYPASAAAQESDYVYAKAALFAITEPVKVVRNAPPVEGKKFPLIVLSHGILGAEGNYAYLCRFLAARGYVVAAPHHVSQSRNDFKEEELFRFWKRAEDVSKVIDLLLADKTYSAGIDSGRIGFIGHSVGGHTGLLLAGAAFDFDGFLKYAAAPLPEDKLPNRFHRLIAQGYKIPAADAAGNKKNYLDPRITAFVIMDPTPVMSGFTAASLQAIKQPVLYFGASKSTIAPSDQMAAFLKAHIAAIDTVETHAGHFVFADEGTWFGKLVASEAFGDGESPDIDRKAIHARIESTCLQFFQTHLSMNKETSTLK